MAENTQTPPQTTSNDAPVEGVTDLYKPVLEVPYIKSLFDSEEFDRVLPLLHKVDKSKNDKLLTGSTLSGSRMIGAEPLTFSQQENNDNSHKEEYNELVSVYYLGDKLCGHPGIIHGGLLATLLDESLCRCLFPLFEKRLGMTLSLQLNYLRPCFENSFVVLKARVKTFHHRRKITVEGHIETLPLSSDKEPVKLVQLEILVVEPKSVAL